LGCTISYECQLVQSIHGVNCYKGIVNKINSKEGNGIIRIARPFRLIKGMLYRIGRNYIQRCAMPKGMALAIMEVLWPQLGELL